MATTGTNIAYVSHQKNLLCLFMLLVGLVLSASCAAAQDTFEIEVYGSETLPQGETAVELHSNFNAEAEDNPTRGVYPSQHSLNESLEVAYAFRDWLQGSFYLLTSINTAYGWQWAGDRVRPQVRLPEAWHWPVGLSISAELGYQRPRFSPDTWTLELLPIVDKKIARWYFAFNPTFDRSLHGPSSGQGFEFSPNVKVSYDIFRRVTAGLETTVPTVPWVRSIHSSNNSTRLFLP